MIRDALLAAVVGLGLFAALVQPFGVLTMNEPKRTEPTKHLYNGGAYVSAAATDIKARFAAIRAEQAAAEKSPRLKAVQSKRVRG